MFAGSKADDERVQVGMGEGDVWTPERRYHLDTSGHEICSPEDDDGGEALHARLAQHVDLVAAGCEEPETP